MQVLLFQHVIIETLYGASYALATTHEFHDQAYRAISTGKLHASLRFHTQPIDVLVLDGSQGDLVLRWVSRLDAFSGYPVQT